MSGSVLYFPPEAFGPFRVLHQIGAGALGPVFRAHEPERGRLVAIKVFQLEIIPEHAAALVQALDALVGRGLGHPGIVAPIAAGLDGHVAYLAQEYAIGESLDVVMREGGSMPLATAAPLIDRLASAIDFAARRGVHHGLLHPRDIIVGEDGPRITGFGVAEALVGIGVRLPVRRPYAAPESESARGPWGSTSSPRPELVVGREVPEGSAPDVLALAAVSWELISGRRLAGDARMLCDSIGQLKTESGGDLGGLFANALSADPAARPSRARSFALGLRRAAGLQASDLDEVETARLRGSALLLGKRFSAKPKSYENVPVGAFSAEPDATVVGPDPTVRLEVGTLERFAEIGAAADVLIDANSSPIAEAVRLKPGTTVIGPDPTVRLQPDATYAESTDVGPRGIGIPAVAAVLMVGILIGFLTGYGWRRASERDLTSAPSRASDPVSATEVALPPPVAAPPAAAKAVPAAAPAPQAAPLAPPPAGPPPPPPVTLGGLQVRTTPPDASVIVNGKLRGTTPLTLRGLPLGSYTIRLTRDGYVDEERRLQLDAARANSSLAVTLKRAAGSGSLVVESRPPGAEVFLNSRLIGKTPLSIPGLPAGPATVRIERDGYQPWGSTVEVKAGERTRVAASLDTRR